MSFLNIFSEKNFSVDRMATIFTLYDTTKDKQLARDGTLVIAHLKLEFI